MHQYLQLNHGQKRLIQEPGRIKRAIEKAKATEYTREQSKIESDKPRMWGEIEKHMSTESKAQVKLDAEYSKLKQNHDVLALWRLIKQVHRTQAGKLNTADASLEALTSYYTIKQKENENIVQFKDRVYNLGDLMYLSRI